MIHSLAHARAAASAAASAGRAVTIESATGAAAYAGPAWFAEVIAQTRAAHPDAKFEALLDCADMAGWAMAAVRGGGIDAIRVTARPSVVRKVRAIAAASGVRVVTEAASDVLDLRAHEDADEACRAWLAAP